jgi:hypothetical protein
MIKEIYVFTADENTRVFTLQDGELTPERLLRNQATQDAIYYRFSNLGSLNLEGSVDRREFNRSALEPVEQH